MSETNGLHCKYCGAELTGNQKIKCSSPDCNKAYHYEYRMINKDELKHGRTVELIDGVLVYTSICARCATKFTSIEGRGGSKYCSEKCRKAAYKEQHRKAALKYERNKTKRGNGIW